MRDACQSGLLPELVVIHRRIRKRCSNKNDRQRMRCIGKLVPRVIVILRLCPALHCTVGWVDKNVRDRNINSSIQPGKWLTVSRIDCVNGKFSFISRWMEGMVEWMDEWMNGWMDVGGGGGVTLHLRLGIVDVAVVIIVVFGTWEM